MPIRQRITNIPKTFILLCLALLLLSGCSDNKKENKKQTKTSLPITVYKVKMKPITITYKSIGMLESLNKPKIKARTTGKVIKVFVHEGMYVKKGQALLKMTHELANVALSHETSKLLKSTVTLEEIQQKVKRAQKLIKQGYISKEKYSLLKTQLATAQEALSVAKTDLEHAKLKLSKANVEAPITGLVNEIKVSEGEFVWEKEVLIEMISSRDLQANLPFAEKKLPHIMRGLKVTLTSPASPFLKINAKITAITPMINLDNRAFNALVKFKNVYGWRPGSTVVGVVLVSQRKTLMIPSACLFENEQGQQMVYLIKNNKAIAQAVRIGYQKNGWVEVISGIASDQIIAKSGLDYLSNNALVKVVSSNSNMDELKK